MKPSFYIFQSLCLVYFLGLELKSHAQEPVTLYDKLISKKWYVSTNFTSFFRNKRFLLFDESQFQTTNRCLSVEPEMYLNTNVTLRFPIQLGFNFLHKQYTTESNSNSYYYYLLNDGYYNTTIQPHFSPKYIQPSYTIQKGDIPTQQSLHKLDIIFQIGINPKLYIPEQRKVSCYFSPSLFIGLMDSYALDYYHRFNSTTSSSGYNIWSWDKETIDYHPNPFLFVRIQTCLGIEIKLKSKLFLDLESGFSSFVYGEGKKDDHVYISLNGGEFNQIYTDPNPDQMFKLVPIHFINRVLLRYSIN
jgi:hypothetical protein